MKVMVLRAPAAMDLDVLAIDLPMRVNLDGSVVGVVTADHDAAAVAHHVECLGDRIGTAAGFDDDVRASIARCRANRGETVLTPGNS